MGIYQTADHGNGGRGEVVNMSRGAITRSISGNF
jgi:hypothetical protein